MNVQIALGAALMGAAVRSDTAARLGSIRSVKTAHELARADAEHLGELQDVVQGDVALPRSTWPR